MAAQAEKGKVSQNSKIAELNTFLDYKKSVAGGQKTPRIAVNRGSKASYHFTSRLPSNRVDSLKAQTNEFYAEELLKR